MKSLVLTMSLLAGTLMGYSQTKVIDYPKIGYRSSEALEFCQVEKSDTALILRGDVYNRPGYWVCVASSSVLKGNTTGKTYRLVRATGIELDKQVTMDESWTRSFSLQFEPVDPKDKSVDYFESLTGENGWVVEDISLEEKEKKGLLCHIEGQVVDNPAYSRLVLAPEGTDIRSNAWISIPVRDGKFAYDFYVERPAMYELYAWSDHMNGMMMPVPFLADKGQVNFTFYHIDKEAEWTSDISLNQELLRFNQEREEKFMIPLRKEEAALEAAGKVLTPEMMELRKQFDSAKTSEEKDAVRAKAQKLSEEGKEFTPEYLAFEEKSAKMMDEYFAYTLAYAESNPTLIGLGRLKEVTRWVERSKQEYTIQKPQNLADPVFVLCLYVFPRFHCLFYNVCRLIRSLYFRTCFKKHLLHCAYPCQSHYLAGLLGVVDLKVLNDLLVGFHPEHRLVCLVAEPYTGQGQGKCVKNEREKLIDAHSQ